ncbi:glycosyltransferase family 2 protein [Actinocrinis sp.]|uniref:glycosyltransferase family 2 protein n=1 Tax=Actinocrinis sp. TaxID=1920516 RepID=UPI002D70D82C|nr:glycosyltransferase family 2 protein [Actinocrinis sp.]HZP50770.1 glycosyltransferase family 2 protein [Actinocrinis sp.]
MPSIDIMMPYYGDVAMMQAAVRSILAQDDPDWHLTVVDDGEAAGVPEWFAALGDPRVSYQRNPVNLGVTGNFRKCVELAKRDRMVMMGSDDLMLPDYVSTVRRLEALAPGAGIVQPGVEVIDEAGRVIGGGLVDSAKRRIYKPKGPGPHRLHGQELAVNLLRGNWLYFPSICWRTDAVAAVGFREDLEVIQDLDMIIKLVERGEELIAGDHVCFQYRRHLSSESAKQAIDGSRFAEARAFFLETAEHLDSIGWTEAAAVSRRHRSARLHALSLVPAALKQRRMDSARQLLRYAASPSKRLSA